MAYSNNLWANLDEIRPKRRRKQPQNVQYQHQLRTLSMANSHFQCATSPSSVIPPPEDNHDTAAMDAFTLTTPSTSTTPKTASPSASLLLYDDTSSSSSLRASQSSSCWSTGTTSDYTIPVDVQTPFQCNVSPKTTKRTRTSTIQQKKNAERLEYQCRLVSLSTRAEPNNELIEVMSVPTVALMVDRARWIASRQWLACNDNEPEPIKNLELVEWSEMVLLQLSMMGLNLQRDNDSYLLLWNQVVLMVQQVQWQSNIVNTLKPVHPKLSLCELLVYNRKAKQIPADNPNMFLTKPIINRDLLLSYNATLFASASQSIATIANINTHSINDMAHAAYTVCNPPHSLYSNAGSRTRSSSP